MSNKTLKTQPIGSQNDFLDKVNAFLDSKKMLFFFLALACTILFGLLLFDARLSFATDDATYIMNALNLVNKDVYPTYQGPLYPMFLGLLIKVVGVKLILFKLFSLVFIALQVVVLFKALYKRIPNIILFASLFLIAFNSYILSYGSFTFTEGFYMFMQALAIWVFFMLLDVLDKQQTKGLNLQKTAGSWLLFGFIFLLLSLSKNVALFAIVAVVVYFAVKKEWLHALLSILAFALFKIPYQLIMTAIYGNISTAQTEQLLRKDFYDPSKGSADLGDLISRFFENFGNYISVHTFKMLGLRGGGVSSVYTFDKVNEKPMEANILLSLIFIALVGSALYFAFKRNKYIFFIILFTGALIGITFFALQTNWNQDRLIVIYLPLIIMVLAYSLYALAKVKNLAWLKVALPLVLVLTLLIQLVKTLDRAATNSKNVKNVMKGNMMYGYPPSVANYLNICKWAGNNISDTMQLLSGKSEEAAVYGKKTMFTRYANMPMNADSILHTLKAKKVHYLIIDETPFGGRVKNLAGFLYQTNPDLLTQIHQEGEMEPAYIFKINYEKKGKE